MAKYIITEEQLDFIKYLELVKQADVNNITFNEVDESIQVWLQVLINGIEFPRKLIDLTAHEEPINDEETAYQVDIQIDKNLRGNDLAFKLFQKFLEQYGHIYFGSMFSTNPQTTSIKKRLSQLPNVGYSVTQEPYKGVLFFNE